MSKEYNDLNKQSPNAILSRNADQVLELLKLGAKPDFSSIIYLYIVNDTPSFFNKIIFPLIEHGIDITQATYFDLLSTAVEVENTNLIYYLLDKKLDPNSTTIGNNSAFVNYFNTYKIFDKNLLTKFIEAGANVEQTVDFNALKIAYNKNDYEMMNFLLEIGLDANFKIYGSRTLIELTFNTEKYDIFAIFIENNPKSHNYSM